MFVFHSSISDVIECRTCALYVFAPNSIGCLNLINDANRSASNVHDNQKKNTKIQLNTIAKHYREYMCAPARLHRELGYLNSITSFAPRCVYTCYYIHKYNYAKTKNTFTHNSVRELRTIQCIAHVCIVAMSRWKSIYNHL